MTPTLSVLEYHLVGYRRTWRGSVLSSFVLPLLTMLGFGVGVGAYVTGGVQGVPYLDWIVPGLIASTAVQVAVGDSTWPVLSNFEWVRVYYAQAAAPLRVADILDGHLAFVVFRTVTSSAAFLLIATAFGTMHSWWAPATLPVAALVGLAPLRWIAYVLPLWHGVDLSRAATLGVAPDWSAAGHLGYLAVWAGAGWLLAYRRFAHRLAV
jgi:lipooligosaccharide transport system permease protein